MAPKSLTPYRRIAAFLHPLPQSLGSIAPGASVMTTVNFNNSTPGASTLKIGGTYSTGSFSSNVRVTVP